MGKLFIEEDDYVLGINVTGKGENCRLRITAEGDNYTFDPRTKKHSNGPRVIVDILGFWEVRNFLENMQSIAPKLLCMVHHESSTKNHKKEEV